MRAAAILTFDKCLYLRGRLRLTTASRLSAYMSSRALATTTAFSYYYYYYTCIYNVRTFSSGTESEALFIVYCSFIVGFILLKVRRKVWGQ